MDASLASSQSTVVPLLSTAKNRPGLPSVATVSEVQSSPSVKRLTTGFRNVGEATAVVARTAVAMVALAIIFKLLERNLGEVSLS